MAPGIEIRDANLVYSRRKIFENLTLTIPSNRWSCLLGPSGIGKTSLLHLISGLSETTQPYAYATDGLPLAGRIAYMTQQDTLLPWLSVLDNVIVGAKLRGEQTIVERARAQTLLELVGLKRAASLFPLALSGGMKQRVVLARTLFENKEIVLMDEPFTSLDIISQNELQILAATLLKDCTVLQITHDPLEALRLADYIYVMTGEPATIARQISLPPTPPRAIKNGAFMEIYQTLLNELSLAKEQMLC